MNPSEEVGDQLLAWKKKGEGKLILLGKLPANLIHHLGFQSVDWPLNFDSSARSLPAPTYEFQESLARVSYLSSLQELQEKQKFGVFNASDWSRPFERFDFTDEWNNLGYGAIRVDDSIWSVSLPLKASLENEIGRIDVDGVDCGSYCALFEDSSESSIGSTLWFNRAVGPIDSYEWRIVEYFLSSFRPEKLPCQPVLHEIPWGHDAAITMRLDCDEDVESARALWELYQKESVPFSLAVHTANLSNLTHHQILKEMCMAGESILSHTATHAPNWGGSYEAALGEGQESARRIQEVIGSSVRYAVSPFHQSPPYALAALVEAGYSGCIGGIIRNDPEFLMARGGSLFGLPEFFIGHSQQYMFHGDCMLKSADPLAIYKAAFDRAFETRTLFGYLDHPFSDRYQYGWTDESQRIAMHRNFIQYIRQKASAPVFLSENDAMDFLKAKSKWCVTENEQGFYLSAPDSSDLIEETLRLRPTLEYRGHYQRAEAGVIQ